MALKTTYYPTTCDQAAKDYFTAYGITDHLEQHAICNFVAGTKEDGIWDEIESAVMMSPTQISSATGHKDLKKPNDANFDVVVYGTSPTSALSTMGWKGNGTDNIAHALWTQATYFDNNDFGYTYSLNSFETGGIRGDIGVFIKGAWYRTEGFASATATNFVDGGGGSGLLHDGLVSSTFGLRRDNDGTKFQEHYINGTLRGARFNNPTDIIVGNPIATIKNGIMGNTNFGVGSGGFFSTRRITTCILHHPLSAADMLKMHNRITTYNSEVIAGGR